jgi:hypothetical protein
MKHLYRLNAFLFAAAFLAAAANSLRADDPPAPSASADSSDVALNGNLAVAQSIFAAQSISTGYAALGTTVFPAQLFRADSLSGVTFGSHILYGSTTTWEWLQNSNGTTSRRVLTLSGEGKLSLFPPANPDSAAAPAIVLDASVPGAPVITVGGLEVLTRRNLVQSLSAALSQNSMSGGGLALGANASAMFSSALALGNYTYAGYNNATAVGTSAYASSNNATAIGSSAYAGSYAALALGNSARAYADYSLTAGYYSQTDGNYAIALGYYASASGENTIAIGPNAYANISYPSSYNAAVAIGLSAEANGDNTIAIGTESSARDYAATAIGYYASAFGYATAVGYYATADYYASTAVGYYANATGGYTTALGYYVFASAPGATALGNYANASGYTAIALGNSVTANAEGSVAIGRYLRTSNYTNNQIVLGSYNEVRADAAFSIGNGTGNWEYNPATGNSGENRSNLFLITTEGKGVFRHKDYVEPTTQPPIPAQPKEALRVKGNVTVEGTLRVQPGGDLPMGPFTATPESN